MIKRFTTVVKKTAVILDVDDRLTPDDNFRATFWNWYKLEKVAKHIAWYMVTFGRNAFIEGVGHEGDYDEEGLTGGFKVIYFGPGGKKI